jgi:hypothetical protein
MICDGDSRETVRCAACLLLCGSGWAAQRFFRRFGVGLCGGGGEKHAPPSLVFGGEDTVKEVYRDGGTRAFPHRLV